MRVWLGCFLILILSVALAVAGQAWVQTLGSGVVTDTQALLHVIWWPATVVRFMVYVILAGWGFPAYVTRLERASQPPVDDVAACVAHQARFARIRRRWVGVLLVLVISELIMAQWPFYLQQRGG